ncbi:hypothetical protein [Kocuria massiliensis]|uniref:hypothetical protein n=1 Tax=Kocuria massiliensis TaxID=1926282 RepID=UPI00117AD942|nr:hypothetical protein [Kocuria massiliensis]
MSPQSPVTRALATFCAGVLVAAALGVAIMALISIYAFGPTSPVRDYIQAIRNGDGGRAMTLLDAKVPESNAAMLDGHALSESTKTLGHLRYNVKQSSEDRAVVTVTYRLNDKDSSTDFPVHRTGIHAGVLEDWAIDSQTLPTINVKTPGVETATLNRQKVGVPQGEERFAVFFPGVYTAQYSSSLLDARESTTTIWSPHPQKAADQNPSLSLDLAPSPAAQESIRRQVDDALEHCASQDTLYPQGCPFEYDFDGRVQGDVSWSIVEKPDSSATIDPQGHWKLTNPQGKARIEFQALDLYTGKVSTVSKTIPFQINADLVVNGDRIEVQRK